MTDVDQNAGSAESVLEQPIIERVANSANGAVEVGYKAVGDLEDIEVRPALAKARALLAPEDRRTWTEEELREFTLTVCAKQEGRFWIAVDSADWHELVNDFVRIDFSKEPVEVYVVTGDRDARFRVRDYREAVRALEEIAEVVDRLDPEVDSWLETEEWPAGEVFSAVAWERWAEKYFAPYGVLKVVCQHAPLPALPELALRVLQQQIGLDGDSVSQEQIELYELAAKQMEPLLAGLSTLHADHMLRVALEVIIGETDLRMITEEFNTLKTELEGARLSRTAAVIASSVAGARASEIAAAGISKSSVQHILER